MQTQSQNEGGYGQNKKKPLWLMVGVLRVVVIMLMEREGGEGGVKERKTVSCVSLKQKNRDISSISHFS